MGSFYACCNGAAGCCHTIRGIGMKTLMVLGVREAEHPFAAAARQEGYAIVTGCQEREARTAASEGHVIVGAGDRRAVETAAARFGVAGILGIGEEAALTAAYVAGRLELPGVPYAEERLFHNLLLLRAFQRDHGFRTPRWRDLSHSLRTRGLSYPLYVSPADGNVLQYMQRVESAETLPAARQAARRSSPGSMVIAQECPGERDGSEGAMLVSAMMVVRHGELMPLLWSDCLPVWQPGGWAPAGGRYPAHLSATAQFLLNGECKRLVSILGLQNVNLPVLACSVPKGRPYILQLGIRDDYYVMSWVASYLYGHDLQRDALRYSAGDAAEGGRLLPPVEGTFLAWYTFHTTRHGVLRHLQFHDRLQPYIKDCRLHMQQSAQIYGEPGVRHRLATILLRFPNAQIMDEMLSRIEELLEVVMDDFPEALEGSV